MVEVLKSIGFGGGDVDPCLYMKRDKNVLIYVALSLYMTIYLLEMIRLLIIPPRH